MWAKTVIYFILAKYEHWIKFISPRVILNIKNLVNDNFNMYDTSNDITKQYNENTNLTKEQNEILKKEVFSND